MKKPPFNFSKGEQVCISPSVTASKRTRSRLQSHGPDFVLFKTVNVWTDPTQWGNDPCIVVGSLSTGWDGWLPTSEVDISKE